MATVFSAPPSVPSENWDDDFEFQQNANNHNSNTDSRSVERTRMSTASSHLTEDWDNEQPTSASEHDKRHSASSVVDATRNVFDTSRLSTWAEQGPSTPTKRLPTSSTENWDDDFEDKADSPAQRGSARKISSKPRQPSNSTSRSRLGANPEPESWDDEFGLSPATPSAKLEHDNYSSSMDGHQNDDDDDDPDDEDDMGSNLDKEEDRTVTARTRRAALSRLTTHNASPPPPVPPIPFSLLNAAPHEQPFPRSPTTSVFSVPTTGHDSVAYSFYHNNSTTHLRPSISRSSVSGLANLPPSPPIHKERRRLRKKSRPHEPAMELNVCGPALGLYTMNSSRESMGGRGDDGGTAHDPQTPPMGTPPLAISPDFVSSPPGSSSIGPSSPPSKTPLLSRIGSVKKWGVRKKRASSTPSEVMLQETDKYTSTDFIQEHTPRPPSAGGMNTPSSARSNWFFRASSGGNQGISMGAASSSSSKSELSHHPPSSSIINTPKASARSGAPTSAGADMLLDTPSKLVKRKSFGFVPIRRNNGPLNDIDGMPVAGHAGALTSSGDLPSDLEMELGLDSERSPSKKKKNRHSEIPQQRHASYGGLGLGRASGGSSDDLAGKERRRPRTRSFSRSKSRDQRMEKEREKEREDAEGSRGFMENVRRISMVGKHKRTKSGVSLASVGEGIRNSRELPSSSSSREQQVADDRMDVDLDSPPGTSSRCRSGTLLPPIELQPPSPPWIVNDGSIDKSLPPMPTPASLDNLLLPSSSATSSVASPPPLSPKSSPNKASASPHSASLGRSAVAPTISASGLPIVSNNVPRRNSLGDLKIPARISQAQVGLRRDLSMVREFASNVEQLKELQRIYHGLVTEVQSVLDSHAQQASSRAASPNFFRPLSRVRSNTAPTDTPPPHQAYKALAAGFYTINSKYRITWECAELLIDLGNGTAGSASTSPPSTSASAPTMSSTYSAIPEGKKSRERAITLSGEQSKPSTPVPGSSSSAGPSGPPLASQPNMAWRASTGRHDLSQRQLLLLREMLNNPDSSFVIDTARDPITEEVTATVNRDWRWGEGMNSTITLPSEESSAMQHSAGMSPTKKRRSSRLVGMSGLRDMLRSLKRSYADNPPMPMPVSSTSLSTESSVDSQRQRHPREKVPTYGRRRAKTSSGPDTVSSARDRDQNHYLRSPYNTASLSMKPSPRRPSLASIFRIGGKNKPSPTASTQGSNHSGVSTDNVSVDVHNRESSSSTGGEEEDWDRLDYPTEFDTATHPRDAATIRGRSPYIQDVQLPSGRPATPNKRSASNSQSSWGESSPVGIPSRATRLSNVEENVDDRDRRGSKASLRIGASSGRPPSRSRHIEKTGSVRSMPPRPLPLLPDTKLAMTPENIKPLLENAREVHAQLINCIAEIRSLLSE